MQRERARDAIEDSREHPSLDARGLPNPLERDREFEERAGFATLGHRVDIRIGLLNVFHADESAHERCGRRPLRH